MSVIKIAILGLIYTTEKQVKINNKKKMEKRLCKILNLSLPSYNKVQYNSICKTKCVILFFLGFFITFIFLN